MGSVCRHRHAKDESTNNRCRGWRHSLRKKKYRQQHTEKNIERKSRKMEKKKKRDRRSAYPLLGISIEQRSNLHYRARSATIYIPYILVGSSITATPKYIRIGAGAKAQESDINKFCWLARLCVIRLPSIDLGAASERAQLFLRKTKRRLTSAPPTISLPHSRRINGERKDPKKRRGSIYNNWTILNKENHFLFSLANSSAIIEMD